MHKLLISLLMATLWSSNVYADGFSASVGTDYSTGKYGGSRSTDVYYVPFVGSYETGAFTFRATIPWIRVTGPGNIVPGGLGGSGSGIGSAGSGSGIGQFGCAVDSRKGASKPEDDGPCAGVASSSTTTTTSSSRRTTESGLGDIVLGASYNVLDNNDWIVDVGARVKLPTASESKRLGSGKTDYAVQANVDKHFGAAFANFGLGYNWLGEPSGVDYDNVAYGSLGGGYKFSQTTIGVSYDWATAAVDGASKPQEVSFYASHKINDHYKLSGVVYSGLSNASSDVGGGITLEYYF